MESQENIEKAISNVKQNYPNNIVEHYSGLIIIAFDELDLHNKKNRIDTCDRFGFYQVEHALNMKPWTITKKSTLNENIAILVINLISIVLIIWNLYLIFK